MTFERLVRTLVIVGILGAVAVPLFLEHAQDTKLPEDKALAGSVWTSGYTAYSKQNCDTAVALTNTYARAGLDLTGATTLTPWATPTVPLISTCGQGLYPLANGPVDTRWPSAVTPGFDPSAMLIVITCSTMGGPDTVRC